MIFIFDIVSSPELKAQVTFSISAEGRGSIQGLIEIGRPSGSGEVNEI